MTDTPTLIGYIFAAIFIFIIGRVVALWYYKIDERIVQQHETNRLLRKLAGEPEIDSFYLKEARNKNTKTVSSAENATAVDDRPFTIQAEIAEPYDKK